MQIKDLLAKAAKIREVFGTTKAKVILGAGTIGVAGLIVAAICILPENIESYRTIAVKEVNGTTVVQNTKNSSQNAYEGMHLYSGDDVRVESASNMTMFLDMDKHVYAEENTHFWLEAEGDSEKSRTRIYLDEGAELNRIDTKLTEGEIYQVDTPNSVMAVRGTVFRVCINYDSEGMAWTNVDVYQGSVAVDLQTTDGQPNGVSEVFEAGEAAVIRADEEISEFVADENGNIKREIDYEALPQETLMVLASYIEDGKELCISKEKLIEYAGQTEPVVEKEELREEDKAKEKEDIEEIQEEEDAAKTDIAGEESGVQEPATEKCISHKNTGMWEVVKEPSCIADGLEQQICSVCGEVIATREIKAKGHHEGTPETTKQASCVQEGEKAVHCTVCKALIRTEQIPMKQHESGEWRTSKENNCTEAGERAKYCVFCGKLMEKESIDATGHDFGGWSETQAAGCENTGILSRTCSRCHKSETETIAATGHSFGDWSVDTAATCKDEGSRSRTCSNCGQTETESIEKTAHSYTICFHDFSSLSPGSSASVPADELCTVCGYVNRTHHSVSQSSDGAYSCDECGGKVTQ